MDNKEKTQQSAPKMTAYHASMDTFRAKRSNPQKESYHKQDKPYVKNQQGDRSRNQFAQREQAPVVFSGSKILRHAHLGGLDEVGKNMSYFEYGNDIIIVDAGFSFPEANMPGIDYVIPDVTYLAQNKSRIKGLVLTHGHMDHIGAVPYLIEKLGSPTIYGSNLTIGMLRDRLDEFGLSGKVKTVVVNPEKDILTLGVFKVEFFRVNHNIPDTTGLCIKTPVGNIIHTADFKFDFTPINEPVIELEKLARYGEEGVLALFCDSTSAGKPGYAVSEREIEKNLKSLFKSDKGRIFVASFSSLISRIQEIIDATLESNRKLTITGRSMLKTVELTSKLGYLKLPEGLILNHQAISRLPDDKIVVLSTGTQGEESSALTRMSQGEHKFFKIKKGDTVILSSSVIPGNEADVIGVYDNLLKEGAKVIDYKLMDIHTGGHAHAEEIKTLIRLVKPKYFVPIHGSRYLRENNCELARQMGMKDENVLIFDNGDVMEFDGEKAKLNPIKLPVSYVMVDGLGVGDVGNIVLRDRQAMAKDGIFVIILTVDHRNSQILTSPDIISRGFVYMRAAEDLIHRSRQEVKNIFRRHSSQKQGDWNFIKSIIRDELGAFLFKETKRRPMIIPVIIEV